MGVSGYKRELSVPLAGYWRILVLVCVLVHVVSLPSLTMANEHAPCDGVTPLRTVNLNPFHLAYGVPVSYGTCILMPGVSKVTLSSDMASHMTSARSESEQMLTDKPTGRRSL